MTKHKVYCPLDDQWVILSASNAFYFFRARRNKIYGAFDFLFCTQGLGERFPRLLNHFSKKILPFLTIIQSRI